MNERIKELAEQANEYAAQRATGDWEVGPAYQDIFNKKFAELIVKECANFLDENSGYDQCNNAWHPEPEDLLEHFGVEE